MRAVVSAYRGLLEARPLAQTINVCSGVTHSLREVIEMCKSITGHDIEVRVNPDFIRDNEVKTLCGSNARLKTSVPGWTTPDLHDTLSWMLSAH